MLSALVAVSFACGASEQDPEDNQHNTNQEQENQQNNQEDPKDPTETVQVGLSPAESCDEVLDHMAGPISQNVAEEYFANHHYFFDDAMNGAPQPVAEDSGASDGDASESPSEFTDTNVQEQGVDEPDMMKTDGNHIYVIADGALQVVKSWPADETEVVGRYDLPSNIHPTSLFLSGDQVVLFSRMNNYYYWWYDESEIDEQEELPFSGTRITFFDISDRTDPVPTRSLEIEGSYVNARKIDNTAYLVSNSQIRGNTYYWHFMDDDLRDLLPERTYEESEEELAELREEYLPVIQAHVRAQLEEIDSSDFLPRQRTLNGAGDELSFGVVHKCTDLYLPSVAAELGVLNISSFTFEDDAELETTGLVARGWQVYASKQNLYVAMSSRSWWWGPWWWGTPRQNESHIHKFSLEGDGEPNYLASGRVDGWILNQFSFSEYDGHLRVATTDNQWEWNPELGESEDNGGNHLIVMKREGQQLVETGSVRDLAPTEQVYSVRFMGDRGYMVTFQIVDPFYTFDLSDPTDPKMLGELKIEGFSSYMHPLDDDHLLTIGLNGDENGMMTGVHLQIFDVTDMHDPKRIHHYEISTGGWSSWSEAMGNHHAFTYQPRLGVLAVPINIWEQDERFSGLILFDATVDGISEIGRVEHGDLVQQLWCQQNASDDAGCQYDPYYHPWHSRIRRSIMMSGATDDEEYVYSISEVGVKVNKTFDPQEMLASTLLRN